jgi:hypothetical protein
MGNQVAPQETPVAISVKPPITDSASFSINGKTYTVTSASSLDLGYGNQGVNIKLDSIVNGYNYYYSGAAKDSVIFSHGIGFYNNAASTGDDIVSIGISVIKKYAKKQLATGLGIFQPKSLSALLDLYAAGNYPYAFDFNRENEHDGIAIGITRLVNGSVYSSLTSYSQLWMRYPTVVNQAAQAGSSFQIVNLVKTDDGQYYITAKFNTTLFDSKDTPVKVSNGYLRLVLAYF